LRRELGFELDDEELDDDDDDEEEDEGLTLFEGAGEEGVTRGAEGADGRAAGSDERDGVERTAGGALGWGLDAGGGATRVGG
jgi:hypothetical protein